MKNRSLKEGQETRVEIIAIREIRNISIIKYGVGKTEEINKHGCSVQIYKFYRNNEKN